MPKSPDPATKTIEAIREGLPPGVELDEREEALLDLARRQARDVAAAEEDILRSVATWSPALVVRT
jgi:hypothetical protein